MAKIDKKRRQYNHGYRHLTYEVIDEVFKLLGMGNIYADVAKMIGITDRTFYLWMQRGRKVIEAMDEGKEESEFPPEEMIYCQFYSAVRKAEATAINRNISIVQKAATQDDWKAAAWWLERKNPRAWGRNQVFREEIIKMIQDALGQDYAQEARSLEEKINKNEINTLEDLNTALQHAFSKTSNSPLAKDLVDKLQTKYATLSTKNT